MSIIIRSICAVFIFIWSCGIAIADGELRFAEIGDFLLESGKVIKDCRLGYRTFGKINADKSNIVLFPTWFMGTTEEILSTGFVGAGKIVDTEKHFVIAFDNIGGGVSSSPSNSKAQPDKTFPEFSLRDMVKAQYILLSEHLHIKGVHAVVGISMGGMQALQWIVMYPDFMKKAVSILGTTRTTAYDLLVWQSEIYAIEAALVCKDKGYNALRPIVPFHMLALKTPHYYASKVKNDELNEMIVQTEEALKKYNPYDWIWQIKAMMTHDIFKQFGGSEQQAAKAVRSKLLVIVSEHDYMVYHKPSLVFSRLLKAESHVLSSDCGHSLFTSEHKILKTIVGDFLDKPL